MRRSGSTTTLVDSTVCIRVSQATARNIVKEVASYPRESKAKVIRRVADSAPELDFTPEHAEIVRMGGQSQLCLTKLDVAIALIIAKYAEEHRSVTVPVMPTKNPSEGAVKYAKVCGLISKPLGGFQEQFFKNFPGENPTLAVIQAKCKVVGDTEKYVVFVGG